MLKRMLAILLVLAMVLTVLPLSVLATETEGTETEGTTTNTEATETPFEAADFTLTLRTAGHVNAASDSLALGLYLTSSLETTVGSYQFTIGAADGIVWTWEGAEIGADNNVVAWSCDPVNGVEAMAVGAEPVLLGTITVTGEYVAGESIVLTDAMIGQTMAPSYTTVTPAFEAVRVGNDTYHAAHGAVEGEWTAWTDLANFPTTAGNYYLTGDLTISAAQTLADCGEITICLNGYDAIATIQNLIGTVSGNTTLNICDCTAHNDENGNYVAGSLQAGTRSAFVFPAAATDKTIVNLYDGIITTCKSTSTLQDGLVNMAAGIFNMYGGQISGKVSTHTTSGGAVRLSAGGSAVFNMEGGKITGNKGVRASAIRAEAGQVNLIGGEISGNNSDKDGIIQLLNAAEVNLTGTVITGNTNAANGTLYLTSAASVLNVDGATIAGNTAYKGSSIFVAQGTVNLKDTVITDNICTTSSGGSSLYLTGAGTLNLEGLVYIFGNYGPTFDARNIRWDNTTTTINVGTLTEGSKISYYDVPNRATPALTVKEGADLSNWSREFFIQENAGQHVLYADGVFSYEAVETHAHEGDEGATWKAVHAAHAIPTTSGNYYLTEDIELHKVWTLTSNADITLCLNGHKIIGDGINYMINVKPNSDGGSLHICDCTGHGVLYPQNVVGNAGSVFRLEYTSAVANFDFDAENITIDGGDNFDKVNTAIFVTEPEIDVCFKNVTVKNIVTDSAYGVIAANKADVNILLDGCTIENNIITEANTGILCAKLGGTINVVNSAIEGNINKATGSAAIYANASTINVDDSVITGNHGYIASALYAAAAANVTFNNTLISNNETERACGEGAFSGIVYLLGNTTTVTLSGTTSLVGNSCNGTTGPVLIQNVTVSGETVTETTPQLILKDLSADSIVPVVLYKGEDINGHVAVTAGDVDNDTLRYINDAKYYYYDEASDSLVAVDSVHAHEQYPNAEWIAWGDDEEEVNKLPTEPGYYYLVGKVVCTEQTELNDIGGELVLCLNGYSIITSQDIRAYYVKGESTTLTLCDCTACTNNGIYEAGKISGFANSAIFMPNIPAAEDGTEVTNGATLNIYDVIITNTESKGNGAAAVVVQDGCVMNFYSGEISKNSAPAASAIFINDATFNMLGGVICDNVCDSGNGATINTSGVCTINISGGEIKNNTAMWGGAINIRNGSAVKMSGGSITGNTVASGGAAIRLHEGSLEISGGEISGNISQSAKNPGAVYVDAGAVNSLTISGSPVIDGNYTVVEEQNVEHNVYLAAGANDTCVTLSQLGASANIGVSAAAALGEIRQVIIADADYITSGNVVNDNGAVLDMYGQYYYDVYGEASTEATAVEVEWIIDEVTGEATATVTLPGYGGAWLKTSNVALNGMTLRIGESDETLVITEEAAHAFYVYNENEAETTITMKVVTVGTEQNPARLVLDTNVAEAKDETGYYYTWTAPSDGVLTIEMLDADWVYKINDAIEVWCDEDGAASSASVEVKSGDVVTLWVCAYDRESYSAVAGTVNVAASFAAAVGTEENPIFLYDIDTDTPIESVEQTGTKWYSGYYAGTTLTIAGEGEFTVTYNGEELAPVDGKVEIAVPAAMGRPTQTVFAITGEGTFSITSVVPVGSQNNPAQLVIGENTAVLAENAQGYFYTWTATETGHLTITMPAGDWSYVINNLTVPAYGDTQWSDSDPVVNPAVIEITEGDEIQVIINTYDPASYVTPAGSITFTAALGQPEEECQHENTTTTTVEATCVEAGSVTVTCDDCGEVISTETLPATGEHSYPTVSAAGATSTCTVCGKSVFAWAGMAVSLESSLQASFVVQTNKLPESGYYAVIEKEVYDKTTGEISIETTRFEASDFVNYNTSGTMKKIVFSGVAAKQMTDRFTVTIYNADGEQISASYTRTIEEYILGLLNTASTKAAMKVVCVDFLNYGAAAQDKFNYRKTELANRGLTDDMKALATSDSAVASVTDARVKGALLAGTAVAAEYEIIPSTVYQTSKLTNVVKAEVSYVNFKGVTVSYEVAAADFANYNTAGTMKKIEIKGTAVADGASPITVKLIDANGNVVDETVECVNYYCARMAADHEVFTMLLKVIYSAKVAFA